MKFSGKSKNDSTYFSEPVALESILDEAHKIKNPDSAIAKVFFDLAAGFKRRIIMTGTPVANRPYDIWAQNLLSRLLVSR